MNPENRNVTSTDCELDYKPEGSWLILNQKTEGSNQQISVFTRYMRYNFHFESLLELDNCWDFTDDDPGNEIY